MFIKNVLLSLRNWMGSVLISRNFKPFKYLSIVRVEICIIANYI